WRISSPRAVPARGCSICRGIRATRSCSTESLPWGAPSSRSRSHRIRSPARCVTYWTHMAEVATFAATAFGTLDPEQLGRLVDQLPVLLWSTDEHLRVTSRRGGGLAVLGSNPAAGSDLHVGQAADVTQASRAVAAHRAALLGTPTAYEISFRGHTFSARVEPLRNSRGKICGVAGVAFDITEVRKSEERLRLIN